MKKIVSVLSVITLFAFLATPVSYSQDWPQFRGPGRDSKITGFKAPSAWPSNLSKVWTIDVGKGDATPVLAGNKIFVNTRQGSDEVLLCIDAATGKELWKSANPAPVVTGPPASHPGPRSTPALASDKIVTLGVAGLLSCFDSSSGKVLWRKEDVTHAVPDNWPGMSPLIVDGMCVVSLGKKDTGIIVAYDLNTGNQKWKWEGEGPSFSSPSIMTLEKSKQIVLLTEKNLMAINPANGNVQWQVAAPTQQRYFNAVSPCIDGQTIYFSGSGTGTKAVKVSNQGDKFLTQELWSNATTGSKFNTPVLRDGFLYGFTDQKRIFCINAATGETVWVDNTVTSDFGTMIDCGEVLMGLTSTSILIILKPDPKKYTEIIRYQVSETPVYTFPVVAGNNIYIKDAESLTLYKIN